MPPQHFRSDRSTVAHRPTALKEQLSQHADQIGCPQRLASLRIAIQYARSIVYTLNDAPTQGADQPQGCNREPNGKVSTKEIVRPVALLSASPVAEVLATSPQLSIVGGTASRFAHTPFQYHRSKKAVWIPDYCLIDLPCLAREPTVAMQQYIHLEYPVDKRQRVRDTEVEVKLLGGTPNSPRSGR